MSSVSKPRLRLYVPDDLDGGRLVSLDESQSHYLINVMRAQLGEAVLLFNGRDGEWLGTVSNMGKRTAVVGLVSQTRPQAPEPDIWLLAAPIKRERIDMVAEKASELGASALWPVITQHTVMSRVNTDRLSAHLREAAEQCERLTIPQLFDPLPLDRALQNWDMSRPLFFLDETGGEPLAKALQAFSGDRPLAILIGPEGGFSSSERAWLRTLPMVRPVTLGPRILRAETAVFAALAIVQAFRDLQ